MSKDYPRSELEVSQMLRQFESDTNILNISIHGVSIWQLLRFPIAISLQRLQIKKSPIPLLDIMLAFFDGLKIWRLWRGRNLKYLALTSYSGTRLKQGEKFDDVWFDILIRNVEGGGKITSLDAKGYRSRVKNSSIEPIYDITLIHYFSLVLARIFPAVSGKSACENIANFISVYFTELDFSKKIVLRHYSRFVWKSRLIRVLLMFLRPKFCIMANTGQFPYMDACRKLGIRFIELQHGIFTKNHPHVLPKESIFFKQKILYPDVIGVYGDFWKNELKETFIDSVGVVVTVGNGLLEKYQKMNLGNTLKAGKKFQIVLTTQGLDKRNLIEFVHEFLQYSKDEFDLIVKLHPTYDTCIDEYLILSKHDCRVKVIPGTAEPNTLNLLIGSDLHLSIASACHYDALTLGLPTVVLKLAGHELMLPLVNAGYAKFAETPQSLSILVSQIKTEYNNASLNYFCCENFPQNINRILEKV